MLRSQHGHALIESADAAARRMRDRNPAAGAEKLERSLALALDAGMEEHVARGYTNLGSGAVRTRRYPAAERHLLAGVAYCVEHDLDA